MLPVSSQHHQSIDAVDCGDFGTQLIKNLCDISIIKRHCYRLWKLVSLLKFVLMYRLYYNSTGRGYIAAAVISQLIPRGRAHTASCVCIPCSSPGLIPWPWFVGQRRSRPVALAVVATAVALVGQYHQWKQQQKRQEQCPWERRRPEIVMEAPAFNS